METLDWYTYAVLIAVLLIVLFTPISYYIWRLATFKQRQLDNELFRFRANDFRERMNEKLNQL